MMSFASVWRASLPALSFQLRPCVSRLSTALPHLHRWGAQIGAPSLRAMAIRSCSLLSLRPSVGRGGGMSHALAPGEAEARRCPFALAVSVVMRLRSSSCCLSKRGLSQAFCTEDSAGCNSPGHLFSHLCTASSRSVVTTCRSTKYDFPQTCASRNCFKIRWQNGEMARQQK